MLPQVAIMMCSIYLVGIVALLWAPENQGQSRYRKIKGLKLTSPQLAGFRCQLTFGINSIAEDLVDWKLPRHEL